MDIIHEQRINDLMGNKPDLFAMYGKIMCLHNGKYDWLIGYWYGANKGYAYLGATYEDALANIASNNLIYFANRPIMVNTEEVHNVD